MSFDLSCVGVVPGLQYETIYTTISDDGVKNAAAIAFVYLGGDRVRCNIFDGSKTFRNISDSGEYVVNITQDPIIFTYSTIAGLDECYFTDDEDRAILRDAGSYLVVDVKEVLEKSPRSYPVKSSRSLFEITGRIKHLEINDPSVKAFNRGLGCLIDSLVNYTRYHLASDEMKKFYDERVEENQRVINKVSDDETIKAIELLKNNQEKEL